MDSEQYINSLFEKAGWFIGRKIEIEQGSSPKVSKAYSNAVEILQEYGGLSIGEVGAGRDCSASDISFRTNTFNFNDEFHNRWNSLKKNLFAIATAHHDHMILLVDENKDTYIFTDPDEELYFIGSFKEMTKKVLLGIHYGEPIEKNT